eukprot:m.31598 g.31598  ORF g.31598 m.31598 type:complete len:179 (+) comp9786_c0_seq2:855-1391(+)
MSARPSLSLQKKVPKARCTTLQTRPTRVRNQGWARKTGSFHGFGGGTFLPELQPPCFAFSAQGSISDLVAQLFGIKTGYYGTVLSNLAKLNLKDAAEESNEKHMQPWMEMCQGADISNTPLTPYLDQELLYNNSLSVDGSKIEGLGFSYEKPAPTLEELKKVVQDFVDLKVFPPGKTI